MIEQTDGPERLERMERRRRDLIEKVVGGALPGAFEYVAENEVVRDWIAKQSERIDLAMRAEDDSTLDDALGSWERAWDRVNQILAEDYRAKHSDWDAWELRYVKWMKISHLVTNGPRGPLHVYVRRPTRPPAGVAWFTVDELIDFAANPGIQAAIAVFDTYPTRGELLPREPPAGEEFLYVNATEDPVATRAVRAKPRRDYR